MSNNFNFQDFEYWILLRKSIRLAISSVANSQSSVFVNNLFNRYEILLIEFLSFHIIENDRNKLQCFILKRRKCSAFQARFNTLGICIDLNYSQSNVNRHIMFNIDALNYPDLSSWCGDAIGIKSILLFILNVLIFIVLFIESQPSVNSNNSRRRRHSNDENNLITLNSSNEESLSSQRQRTEYSQSTNARRHREVYQAENPFRVNTRMITQLNPTPQEMDHNRRVLEAAQIMSPRDAIKQALKQASQGNKPDVPFFNQPALREALDTFASKQYKATLQQCYICKERWFVENEVTLPEYKCTRCKKEMKSGLFTMSHTNTMDPYFCNPVVWNEYLNLPVLSEVEKRLIALRMIVLSIYRLKGGDFGCSGDAVNLVQDISELVDKLPRGILNIVYIFKL
jgi:hypothetical protein